MNQQTLTTHTKHGDMLGEVSADFHDHYYLVDLAREFGIDTDRYFIFGVNASFDEKNREDLDAVLRFDFLAVDGRAVGRGIDFVQQYIQTHNGELPYIRFQTPVTFREILTTFKRFDMVIKLKTGPVENAFEEACIELARRKEGRTNDRRARDDRQCD
jgi:hypothetical protein